MKLVIAEKERMALNIAKALGNYKRIRRGFVNIYQLNDALVLPLKGHIMNYVTRKDLTYWNYSSVDKILEDPFSIVKVMSAKGYYSAIRSLAQSCSEIIIATDPDEEGENIGLEIIEVLKGIERPVRRLWLTTTAPSDIRNAFFDLREFNRNVALSVEARRKIDSITGFAGTRELTLRLRKDVVSFGRVQTSTLWMIVVREREIKSFIPVSYWEILADIEGNEFYHVSNPFFDSKLALEKFRRISDARNFVCSKVDYSNEVIHPPRPLNTAEMLKAATSMIRISPSRIMFLAERLYLYGRITYPRVDNQTYTKSFNHKANLERLVKGRFGDYASMLIQQGLLYPTKGRYSEDHQPITPIAPISEINDPAATRLYELILRHYLSLFGPDAIVGLTKVEGKIEDEMFKAEAREIKERGFYKVSYHQPKEKNLQFSFMRGKATG
jgi:DNA topoisomerase IA